MPFFWSISAEAGPNVSAMGEDADERAGESENG